MHGMIELQLLVLSDLAVWFALVWWSGRSGLVVWSGCLVWSDGLVWWSGLVVWLFGLV